MITLDARDEEKAFYRASVLLLIDGRALVTRDTTSRGEAFFAKFALLRRRRLTVMRERERERGQTEGKRLSVINVVGT